MLLNTEKGRKLFEAVKDKMNTFPANLEDCLQPNMIHPSEIHPRRDQFEEEYAKKGFKYVYFKYGEEGWRETFRRQKRKLKNFIKRLIGKNENWYLNF